jgi:hypothetical protein
MQYETAANYLIGDGVFAGSGVDVLVLVFKSNIEITPVTPLNGKISPLLSFSWQ